ncbi:MAG: DNA methyltransferase [Candidatus Helarchaeota archaeon]
MVVKNIHQVKIFPLLKTISEIKPKVASKYHIWWAKKPGNVIDILIKHFTKPNDIILDPFSGSGVVLEHAIKQDRKCIATDINPLSIFIMNNLVSKKSWEKIEKEFQKIMVNLKNKSNFNEFSSVYEFYNTLCPKCNEKALIHYVVWNEDKPHAIRLECNKDGILTKYNIDDFDTNIIRKIDAIKYESIIENIYFLENSRINISKKKKLEHFFTKRNFLALTALITEINSLENSPEKEFLKFIFSSSLRKTTKLISTKGGLSVGFWIPKKNRKENNVFLQFLRTKEKIFKMKDRLNQLSSHQRTARNFEDLKKDGNTLIKRLSATKLLKLIKRESVDLVITDPPYGDEVPYLELSQLYNPWLGFQLSLEDFKDEIILTNSPARQEKRPNTKEGIENYAKMLQESFTQTFDSLKFDHFACIWFKESDLKLWNILIESVLNSGFTYIDQISMITNVRSLKPKFTPNHSLIGHVLIFFIKLKNQTKNTITLKWGDIHELIRIQGQKIILKNNGKATTSELYNGLGIKEEGIISKLIKNNALKIVSKKYNNLFKLFDDYFKLDKQTGYWSIN